MLIHHVFIPTSNFFLLKFAILRSSLGSYDQGSVEVSCPWRGACARKGGRVCFPCKAANTNCNANCQCRWCSCNEVLNVRQPDMVLKQLNIWQSDIFPYFSSKSKKCLYENVLPLFTILKRFQAAKSFELDVFANPVYRVRSHPSAWYLETFQWHGRTRSLINSIFLFEIYQFSVGNILPLFRILKGF